MITHPESLLPGNIARDTYFKKIGIYAVKPDDTILEIGCGTGFFLSKFKTCNKIGIDANFINLKMAKKFCPDIFFLVADAHNLPFKKAFISKILMTGVLEHFNNIDLVYDEIKRVSLENAVIYQTIDIRPKYTYLLWKLVFSFDCLYEKEHEMLHKIKNFDDNIIPQFYDKDKFQQYIEKNYAIASTHFIGNIFLNLFFTLSVLVNIFYTKLLRKEKLKEDCYGEYSPIINRTIYRFYATFIVPIVKFFIGIYQQKKEALYYLIITKKIKI